MARTFSNWLRTLGAPEDPVATNTSAEWSAMSLLKAILSKINDGTLAAAIAAATGINTQTGASYTLVFADRGKTIEMNNAGANILTIPPNASVAFAIGAFINVTQYGAGQTTLTPGSGVTIRSELGLKTAGQYAMATLYKRDTNEWVAGGDLVT